MLANLPPALPHALRRSIAWLNIRKMPALMLTAIVVVAALVALASSRMNAQTQLFSAPLHPNQAIEVERALTIWNEPYAADPAHTQVFVSAARRRDVLLRLTLAGLPHRYVPTTMDVLDQAQSAFLPQSVVDDRRRAGIEGDLVAGLRRINGVADASVVIAPALADPLAPEDARSPASASVQLVMQAGAQLSAAAASGIKRFVAAGYPGLTFDRVIVVDGTGGAAGAQMPPDRIISREARVQNSIQSALDAVFGMGAAIVRVSVRGSGLERSSQNTRVTPHGLLESDSGKERGSEGGKRFERDRDRARYAYDTLVETQTSHADAVAHIAVAVFLDSRKIGLDQTNLVKDLVRAAAGADLASGDDIVVQALPFLGREPAAAPSAKNWIVKLVPPVLLLAGLGTLGWWVHASRVAARAQAHASASAVLGPTLQRELPQTAAYVLGSMPPKVRDQVLREYPLELRERILRHMNGRAHG